LPTHSAIAVVGGAKFDEASLVSWLRTLPRDAVIVCCAGRFTKEGEPYANSCEAHLIKHARQLELRVDVVDERKDLYLDRAKDVQLLEVLRVTSGDIFMVGEGSRPKQLRAIRDGDWAMSKATLNGRELVEVG
jgi:hypothetical protein